MANSFSKGWRYFMAWLGFKIDEHADPKVLIQQAIDESQRQHHALVQQAATVIGNQRQIEMKLGRQMEDVAKYQQQARTALSQADKFRKNGDEERAQRMEDTARQMATHLVHAEQSMEDLKTLQVQAVTASDQARKAVEQNANILQGQLAERTKLLSQLEQARMQESVAASLESMSALTGGKNTPNMAEVRERIEAKYAKALGRAELASNSAAGRMLELEQSSLNMEGENRLELLRKEMRAELEAGPE